MANKKSPTEIEEFYIRANPEGLTETQMSEKFGIVLSAIKKIYKEESEKRAAAPVPSAPVDSTVRDLMTIKGSNGKRSKGVAIMNVTASEILDETSKNNRQKARKLDNSSYIAKSYPGE